MKRRFSMSFLAALSVSSLVPAAFSARAQTRPDNTVRAAAPSQSKALVQQLLREGKIMRSSEVKRGMKGYAVSVFQGTHLEKFPIEVIGNMEKMMGGGDLVLIRVTGGTVIKRNSGIVAGMSGSPVYINGKMLGAIAIGFGFPKEAIGGVTPITQMIETSIPDSVSTQGKSKATRTALSAQKDEVYTPREPLVVRGRRIEKVVVSRDKTRLALAGRTMTMRPVSTRLQVSGMSPRAVQSLAKALSPHGIELVSGGGFSGMSEKQIIGPSSKKTGVNPTFQEGSALGVQLVSGDIDMSSVGTLTFRRDKRVLGYGHPMFGLGAVSMPMCTSYIHDIFPSYDNSFKLASPVRTVGSIQQDNKYAIGGTVGALADTIPFRLSLKNGARNINRTLNMKVVKDPMLTPVLLSSVTSSTLSDTLGMESNKMVRVNFRMKVKGAPEIRRSNYLYAQDEVTSPSIGEMFGALMLTQNNPFGRGNIQSLALDVTIEAKRQSARIKGIFADRNKARAGDTVKIRVEMETQPEPGRTFARVFSFRIPADAPSGTLRVAAGPASEFWSLRSRVGEAPPQPQSIPDLITEFNKTGSADALQVQVSTPRTYLVVDKKRVPSPPPTWEKMLRAAPSTSVASFNEVQQQEQKTEYSLSGMQMLSLPVESARISDRIAPDSSTANSATPAASAAEITPAVPSSEASVLPSLETDDAAAFFQPTNFLNPEYSGNLRPIALSDVSTSNAAAWREQAQQWWNAIERQSHRTVSTQKKPSTQPRQSVQPQHSLQPRQSPTVVPTVRPIVTPTALAPSPSPTATPSPTPTPEPTTPAEGATLTRPTRSWVQGAATDFMRGDFRGAQVTSDGTLRPAPQATKIATTSEPFAWSVAADRRGNTFIGTGNGARLLRVNAQGETRVIYQGEAVAITALAVDGADNLYAGVSPGGRVLRFSAEQTARGTAAPTIALQTNEDFVWALDFDSVGRLLVGTGGTRGAIYRFNTADNSSAAKALAVVPQRHIRALSSDATGIYAGTADDAMLYRIDAQSGVATPLFESKMPATPAVSTQPGVVTSGDAGGGSPVPSSVPFLLQSASITSMSSVPSTTENRPEVLAVAAAPEGVYFGLSNSGTLYRYSPKDGVQSVYPSPQNAIYALRRAADGSLFMATGEKGIVYRIVPRGDERQPEGARVLEPLQTQALSLNLAPSGEVIIGTGNNAAVYKLAPNVGAGGTFVSNIFDAGNVVRWGALRLIGEGVQLETRSGNTEEPDATWSAWQNAARNDLGELRIASPGARFLQYRANFQRADANLSRVEAIYRTPNSAPGVAFTAPKGGEYWRAKQNPAWSGTDADSDTLRYALSISRANAPRDWKAVSLSTQTSATAELDTTKFADGDYLLKVRADDSLRNPDEPKAAEATSLPFTIDNTAPTVSGAALSPDVSTQTAPSTQNATSAPRLTLRAVATDATSPIIGAEYRLITKAQLEKEKATTTPATTKPATTEKSATQTASAAKPAATTKPATASTQSGTKAPSIVPALSPGVATASNTSAAPAGVPAEILELEKALAKIKADASAPASSWNPVAAEDGLFDSRRENLLALVEVPDVPSLGEADRRVLQLRVRDAAGNTVTTTLSLP